MRRLLIRTISLEGEFEFIEADGALDAVKKLGPALPDLIILDIGLGAESGFDLLSSLKSRESTASIPVIICTASGDQATVDKSERLGAAGYVPKPISADVMRKCVRQILNPPEDD
jgi:DNA-binding NarL/FixJ family response regulator